MSSQMNEENKRWSAKRKSVLVLEIIQGKTTVAEASRQFDLAPSEFESWVGSASQNCYGECTEGQVTRYASAA